MHEPVEPPLTTEDWVTELNAVIVQRRPDLLELAEQAVRACPRDYQVLYLAAVAALRAEQPARCWRFLQRIEKYYITDRRHVLLHALALA